MKDKSIKTVHVVDAPAGAGKTYSTTRYMHNQCNGLNNQIYVAPTKALVNETFDELVGLIGVDAGEARVNHGSTRYRKVHGDTLTDSQHSVFQELVSDIKYINTSQLGENVESLYSAIVATTHSSFLSLAMAGERIWLNGKTDSGQALSSKHRWDLIIDEALPVFETLSISVGSASVFASAFDVSEVQDSGYLQITFRQDGEGVKQLKRVVRKSRSQLADVNEEVLKDFVKSGLSGVVDFYVDGDCWQSLTAEDSAESKTLNIFSVLSPKILNGFRSVTFMSAACKDTLIYQLWSKCGVSFNSHNRITNGLENQRTWMKSYVAETGLQYESHPNGALLTIKYLTERNWSKNYIKRELKKGNKSVLEIVESVVLKEFEEVDFIWNANNEFKADILLGKGVQISGAPHGLNEYKQYHNGAFLMAINLDSTGSAFLRKHWGIDDEGQKRAFAYHSLYQAATRLSIRNPSSTEPVTIVVPSLGAAEYIAGFFEGAKIERLEGLPDEGPTKSGRPKSDEVMSGAERSKMTRMKKSRLADLEKLSSEQCYVSTGKDFYDRSLQKVRSGSNSVDKFFDALSLYAGQTKKDKEDSRLVSPAVWDGESHTKEEVVSAGVIVLDVDDNEMPPSELAVILSGIKFLAVNTFSGDGRYRVFILLSQPVTAAVYENICNQIVLLAEGAGYSDEKKKNKGTKRHGIDRSKLGAQSKFYLPCKAVTGEPDSFSLRFDGGALDPVSWIDKPRIKYREFKNEYSEGSEISSVRRDNSHIVKLVEQYQSVSAGQGLRNAAFFKLTVALKKSGLPLNEVEAYLVRADSDQSRQKAGEIRGAMKSLESGKF